jgi:hypothetical protein
VRKKATRQIQLHAVREAAARSPKPKAKGLRPATGPSRKRDLGEATSRRGVFHFDIRYSTFSCFLAFLYHLNHLCQLFNPPVNPSTSPVFPLRYSTFFIQYTIFFICIHFLIFNFSFLISHFLAFPSTLDIRYSIFDILYFCIPFLIPRFPLSH